MPYLPDSRQYREFAASNFQPITEDANDQEESYKVRGYFCTFNQEYTLYERTKYWPAEYEQIDPHALDEADMSDVVFQYDHEGQVLARQRNGSLEIGVDDHGAWCVADLGGCQRGRDLFESIKNGLVVEMSFGFTIYSDEDSTGYTSFKDEAGDYHTTITRIAKVFDCSAVTFPANPYTDISEMRKRSYLAGTIEADMKAAEEAVEQERLAQEAEQERLAQEQAEAERIAAELVARRKRRARAMQLL